ncbi:MAG: hypothetical protein KDJ39_14605 [Gammaproteobacteria bacterium]|nr:hypothetical protein [Gammaproteobacteria bacterium]
MKYVNDNTAKTTRPTVTCVAAVLLVPVLPSLAAADATGGVQNVLESPSRAVLSAEARGRVTIYDGLKDETVERALDR